jgi:hypothetical protein
MHRFIALIVLEHLHATRHEPAPTESIDEVKPTVKPKQFKENPESDAGYEFSDSREGLVIVEPQL